MTRGVAWLTVCALVAAAGCSALTNLDDLGGGNDASSDVPVSDTSPDAGGCTAPLTRCGNACVDTTTDNANCGSCNSACAAPTTCGRGQCSCTHLASTSTPISAPNANANDAFGASISLSASTLLVGAPNATATGVAYVFTGLGPAWPTQATLQPDDGVTSQAFGAHVAVSGDTAVVLATPNGTSTLYVFGRTGSSWFQTAKVTLADAALGVALDKTTALLGGFYTSSVYVPNGPTWTSQQTLIADYTASQSSGQYFGFPVSISGDTALVGAGPFDTQGQALHLGYVYTRSGTVWSLGPKLTPPGLVGNSSPNFRFSLAISRATAVIATNHGGFAFSQQGSTWSETDLPSTTNDQNFGSSSTVSGAAIVVGAADRVGGVGSAYFFAPTATAWSAPVQLTSGVSGDTFGASVASDGAFIAVSAPNNADPGTVYVFTCGP